MPYDSVYHWLGWPQPEQVFEPEGAGASVYAEFARNKIGGALKLAHPGVNVRVGVLVPDPRSDNTEAPLAVVCEFPRGARDEELDLAHLLAWNFSRTALLITLEPHRLIAWSCFLDPTQPEDERRVCELPLSGGFRNTGNPLQRQVRDLLHWVSLITSRIQREHPTRFPVEGRADALLLKNLRHVRRELLTPRPGRAALRKEFCHDLLARVIFTQFLFHRKDGDGQAFFSERLMKRLHEDRTLTQPHGDLASVLTSKQDTYALFRWMDERFNGDLFPGKEGDDKDAREAAWQAEYDAVDNEHLTLLADLVAGNLDTKDRQLTLWPYYSFDTLPLEFISSVYEEFLTEEKLRDKAYYTPSHLVDYVLDAVLPWNDESWNIRILDPCCGSGIFLVKAFQRLIHRWRLANKRDPLVSDLKPILGNNLVGVDKNPEAVRVACFSLYLAMADAIEPKHYVTRENAKVFPPLRGKQLLAVDFFDEAMKGLRTKEDANTYELVIGNAPWGDGSIKPEPSPEPALGKNKKPEPTRAQVWAQQHEWPVPNFDIGPVFLGKAAHLVNGSGRVAMIQTASILYWRDGRAVELRKRLFNSFTFDEITNLSALRREMFAEAIGPSCVVVFGKHKPQPDTTLYYFTPKPTRALEKRTHATQPAQGFTVEPQDITTLTHREAAEDPIVWPVLALAGRRDLNLLRRLGRLPNLSKLDTDKLVKTRAGVVRGKANKEVPELRGRRYFDATQFPPDVFLQLDAETVPVREMIRVDAGHGIKELGAFKNPQLLLKHSFSAKSGRFRAALVKSSDPEWGIICTETYLSVSDRSPGAAHIQSACVVYNSLVATYFLFLTSGRIGHYITEVLSSELVTVPLPSGSPDIPDISALDSFDAVDAAARKMFALTAADWQLIEDFLHHTLPGLLRKAPGPSRQPTCRETQEGLSEPEMSHYANTFVRVVKATFGRGSAVAATIYTEPEDSPLPVRMVTIHLDWPGKEPLTTQPMDADGLLDQLAKLHSEQLKKKPRASSSEGLGFQRVAFFFHPSREAGARAMNLTIVKPDECRYWTRSMAMRDADQLTSAILKASERKKANS